MEINIENLGHEIDCALDNNNQEHLLKIIDQYEYHIDESLDSKNDTVLCYFIANVYSGLRKANHLDDIDSIWAFDQTEIYKEIFFLRKAKNSQWFSQLSIEYQCSILTNLANVFNHIGRTIYALSLYDEVLSIEPRFFMAILNKGIALETLAIHDYDPGHKTLLAKLAHQSLLNGCDLLSKQVDILKPENKFYKKFLQETLDKILRIDVQIGQCLNEDNSLNDHSLGYSQDEQFYRKWCLENNLFLNSMNELGKNSIAAHDPLNLPNLVRPINLQVPHEITQFNILKQEFITFRALTFQSISKHDSEFYDSETCIVDDNMLSIHNISTEKIKLAFIGFYSLFDKIAYFLNDYFNLDFNKKQIYFNKIWTNKNNKKKLNTAFFKKQNLPLRGLYFISKDLFFNDSDEVSFEAVLEPEGHRIADIRNNITHKFLYIYEELDKSSENNEISTDELLLKTIHLARLAREALIYLSFAVHTEEQKQKDENELLISHQLHLKNK
jgi:hypothetical protein